MLSASDDIRVIYFLENEELVLLSCEVSTNSEDGKLETNLHVLSNSVSLGNSDNISKFCLLKMLHTVLSVNVVMGNIY